MQRLELAFHRSLARNDPLQMSLLGATRRGDPGTEPTPETTAPRVGRRYVESDHAARRRLTFARVETLDDFRRTTTISGQLNSSPPSGCSPELRRQERDRMTDTAA